MSDLVTKLIATSLLFCFAAAQTRQLHQTAVDGLIEGDFTDDEATDVVYQTVSTNYGAITNNVLSNGWSISAINATIEVSTSATYAYNYNSGNGSSRLNVTAQLSKTASSFLTPPPLIAHIGKVPCAAMAANNLPSNWLTDNSSVILPMLTITSPANSVTSAGNQAASIIYPELIDYEDADSVGIYTTGPLGTSMLLACQNLQPPFPDFPNDWSATIEMTDTVNGTTYVMVEQYSQSLNKLRLDLHSFGAQRIIITDTASSSVTFINPQNGSCSSRPTRRTNWITGEDNVTLLSTAEVFHFSQDQVSYVQGLSTVRGIQCEQWTASFNISNNWANASLTANFYFPIDQWLVDREDYHRMLKQATINGTFNGRAVNQIISFFDFRPRSFTTPTFAVCAISPYGSGCNCTDALRRQAFSSLSAVTASESDGDDFTVAGQVRNACRIGQPVPHGFIRAQSGPYVGLTAIGMIGGGLITGLAMYMYYRKRTGLKITDNFGSS